MLKLNFQYFGHLMWRTDSLEKTLMLGKIESRRRRGWWGWDGWMASPTQWTWVWASSGGWWWTGKPGVLQPMGLQSQTWLSNWSKLLAHRKSKKIPEKHLLLLHWLHQSLWLCGSQQTVENSQNDGNIRPPYLFPEKPLCQSRRNGLNQTWNKWQVPNWERSMPRLYNVTLLI